MITTAMTSPSARTPHVTVLRGPGLYVFMGLTILMMIVAPLVFSIGQFRNAQRQHRIVTTYIPVDATVISARVYEYRGSKGYRSYWPEVEYKYEVGHNTYTSQRYAPVHISGSVDWANGVVARFTVGGSCQAYYDPENPSQAVLIRKYSIEPYFYLLLGGFCLCGGSFMALLAWQIREKDPIPVEGGWFEIKPEQSAHDRLLLAKVTTAIWYGVGFVMCAHLFWAVPLPYSSHTRNIILGYAAPGLVPLGFLVRYYLLCRAQGDARVVINVFPILLGHEFEVGVTQRIHRSLQFRELQISVSCKRTTRAGRSRDVDIIHEREHTLFRNHPLPAGQPLEFSQSFTIPGDHPPSTPVGVLQNPRIDWELTLIAAVKSAPDYRATFPLVVERDPRSAA